MKPGRFALQRMVLLLSKLTDLANSEKASEEGYNLLYRGISREKQL
jgi:hypothetical protein